MASNSSGLDCPHVDITYGEFKVVVSCMYLCTFTIALFLNSVAAWICVHLRSTTSFMVYLQHLVAADLLMTLAIPVMAASRFPGAAVGLKAFACRYSDVIFYCCMYTTIGLMGLISLDRFFKIARPGGVLLGQSPVFCHVMAACVWAVIFGGTGVPTFILTDQSPANATGDTCMSMKGPAGLALHSGVVFFTEVFFWFVSAVVVVCYAFIAKTIVASYQNSGSSNSRGKRRTQLRVFLVVAVFCVCFVPLHVMRVPLSFRQTQASVCTEWWMTIGHDVALWLSSANGCLDPLLYVCLCKQFRSKVQVMMQRGACCRKPRREIEPITSMS